MQQVQFAGSWHSGMSAAAAAWAETALPEPGVVDPGEDPGQVAEALEAYWWGEAQRIGEGAPDDVNEAEWRASCRSKLIERIELSRKAT